MMRYIHVYLVPGITDSEVAVSSSYLVLAGTWYNRTTTPLRHASNASSYHTHTICRPWGGERGGTTLLSVYGYHNNDAYMVFYSRDLEHSATYYYYCCCCVLYATPHCTRNTVPHY